MMVHCQDAKKISAPPGAVSWLTTKESSIKASVIVLGASTMHRTMPSSLSIAAAPSAEEGGAKGARSAPPARCSRDCSVSVTSSVDVSSATLISVQSGVKSASVELDSSCVIHPFHVHKMDSEKPVAMADVAEPRGPARAGAGGPVVTEISMTAATDRTGASGPRRSKTDAPVIPEFR